MRIFNLVMFLFVLSAMAIGTQISGTEQIVINRAIDNVTSVIENISLENVSVENFPEVNGIFNIVEKYIHLVGAVFTEALRAGINFGKNNPEYFEAEFILKIIIFVCIAIIVSFLIQPLFYILIFLVMGIMWIYDVIKRRKKKNEQNS